MKERKERTMPHVIVKLWSGRQTSRKKARRSSDQGGHGYVGPGRGIGFGRNEDVRPEDWTEKVFKPDILGKPQTIYKKPGYNPL
jgi:4-oxalocrotonate tautomerase